MKQLVTLDQLNPKHMADLDALCAACKTVDGNVVALYKHLLNQRRPLPCNFLYYDDNRLIGFLSTFFFYERTCEVALMVAPAYRKKKLAMHLLIMAFPLIYSQGMSSLLFSTPHEINGAWLAKRGFTYKSSEYQMHREQPQPVTITNDALQIRPAQLSDLPILCELDRACFATPQVQAEERFKQMLEDTDYRLFVAQVDGVTIGKAHIAIQHGVARFTDIAVLPSHQKRGYGSTIISYCINNCLEHGLTKLSLDVEANNEHALRLYTHLGFIITNAYDFWSIPITKAINITSYSPNIW